MKYLVYATVCTAFFSLLISCETININDEISNEEKNNESIKISAIDKGDAEGIGTGRRN